ncbi:hypothetical protein U1Q18_040296 [Sarracenia purpurea var. burkii]
MGSVNRFGILTDVDSEDTSNIIQCKRSRAPAGTPRAPALGGNDKVRSGIEIAENDEDRASGKENGEISGGEASSVGSDPETGGEVDVKTIEDAVSFAAGDKHVSSAQGEMETPSFDVLEGEDAGIDEDEDEKSSVGEESKVESVSEEVSAVICTEKDEKGRFDFPVSFPFSTVNFLDCSEFARAALVTLALLSWFSLLLAVFGLMYGFLAWFA